MGGAIMTLVYNQLYKELKDPNITISLSLEVDRSFSDFSRALYAVSQYTVPVVICYFFARAVGMMDAVNLPKSDVTVRATYWDYLLGSAAHAGANIKKIGGDHSPFAAVFFKVISEEKIYSFLLNPIGATPPPQQTPNNIATEDEEKEALVAEISTPQHTPNNIANRLIHALDVLLIVVLLYIFCPLPVGAMFSGVWPCMVFVVPACLLADYIVLSHLAFLYQVRGESTSFSTSLAAFIQALPQTSMLMLCVLYPLILALPMLVPGISLLSMRLSVFAVPVISNALALFPQPLFAVFCARDDDPNNGPKKAA